MASVWMHELSWDKVAAYLATDDVALVPIGATEQHGLHAPLMLDTGWAIKVSEEAAALAGILAALPVNFTRPAPGCLLGGGCRARRRSKTRWITDMFAKAPERTGDAPLRDCWKSCLPSRKA